LQSPKILAIVVCYNTAAQTKKALAKFPATRNYDVLIVNDASTDETSKVIKKYGFKIIEHKRNKGVGGAIKSGLKYALENNYQVVVVLAGNNKDNPQEIPKLIEPIVRENIDYVQGSRFLRGGRWDNLPLFRWIMVRVHALLFTLVTGAKCTDALNGFRAYKLSLFNDSRIDIWQDWLDRYEFETYLHFKVLKYGYRFKEVPVSKVYPRNKWKVRYSHIRPIIDWWIIMRPLVLLGLGLRH